MYKLRGFWHGFCKKYNENKIINLIKEKKQL